jgi:hypothetical protein
MGMASDSDSEDKVLPYKIPPLKKRLPSKLKQLAYLEFSDEEPMSSPPKQHSKVKCPATLAMLPLLPTDKETRDDKNEDADNEDMDNNDK